MEGNPLEEYLKDYIQHLLWVGLSLCGWMLIKDFLARLAAGVSFFFDQSFSVGDQVILDGERCVILSIGVRQTTFQIEEDGEIRWRFVPNDKIVEVRLEKVVDCKKTMQKHL